jgi:hypothetical protein
LKSIGPLGNILKIYTPINQKSGKVY